MSAPTLEELVRKIVQEEVQRLNPALLRTPADHRMQAGLSVEQLAKAAGVCVDVVHKYESGRISKVDDVRVEKRMRSICRVLGIDLLTYRQSVRAQMQKLEPAASWISGAISEARP